MYFKVINSNSHGNGYVLDVNNDKLIVEVGVPMKEILKTLCWELKTKPKAIVTHWHTDHCGKIKQYLGYGIPVYSTPQCATKYEGVVPLQPKRRYQLGNFFVTPLLVPHNAECYSYVIDIPSERVRMLFITDASAFPYKIPDVNFICIETNYCEDKLMENLDRGGVSSQYENHMELETAIDVVKRHYSPSLREVVCLHLSDGNSDENTIKKRFYEELGIRVRIAEPNLSISFYSEEF